MVVSVLVVTAFGGSAAVHTGDDGLHHHDGWMGTHGGMGGWGVGGFGFVWMLVWTLVVIGLPLALVYLLLTRRRTSGETTDDDALALLRRHYAAGEVDEEEYEARRARLLSERE